MPSRTPVVVFLYNRPHHALRTLEALERCDFFSEVEVILYCDGARQESQLAAIAETRDVANRWATRVGAKTVLRASNLGLSKSIVAGVTEACRDFGRVIVLEDDLVVRPDFLTFMLSALDRYADDPRLFIVSGFAFAEFEKLPTATFFLPLATSWGWATWERAWKHFPADPHVALAAVENPFERRRVDVGGTFPFTEMLRARMAGLNDSWAVFWHWALVHHKGLALFPKVSLVWNGGRDGSGTHEGNDGKGSIQPANWSEKAFPSGWAFPEKIKVSPVSLATIQSALTRLSGRKPTTRTRLLLSWINYRLKRAIGLDLRLKLTRR